LRSGAATVIFAVGPRLAKATSTFAGHALARAVAAGPLAASLWIAMFGADLALYLGKGAGRNCVVFDPPLDRPSRGHRRYALKG
jgi:hypothetical protein